MGGIGRLAARDRSSTRLTSPTPAHQPSSCSCSTASGTSSADHALIRPRYPRASPRCPAGRTRSRSRICCASSTRPATCSSSGIAHFNHQLRGTRPTTTSGSSPPSAALARLCRFVADRGDVARAGATRAPVARGRGAREPLRVLRARARALRGRRRRARPHARRSGRNVSAAPAARRRPARACGNASAARLDRPPAARLPPAELREFLDERHVAFVDDETNDDVAIPRNRVRAELLPLLESRFNPAIVDVLADEAELARETWDWLDAAADDIDGSRRHVRREDAPADRRRARSTARCRPRCAALVRLAGDDGAAGRRPLLSATSRLRSSCSSPTAPAVVDAPGQRVERIGATLVLTGRPAGRGRQPDAASGRQRTFSGIRCLFQERFSLPEAGCAVSAEAQPASHVREASAVRSHGQWLRWRSVRRDLCRGPSGRPESSSRATGSGRSALGGRKKLQDFFVDRKVAPATARHGAARGRRSGPDRLGGGSRYRRGVSGDGPRANRATLET